MEDRLIVTASPHIREASTTRGLMGNVVIALLPAVLAAGLIFGVQALVLVAVTTLACVAFEYIYEKLLKKHGFRIYELLTPDDIQRNVIDRAGAEMKAFEHVNYCLAVRIA